jgi:hypothetical protein
MKGRVTTVQEGLATRGLCALMTRPKRAEALATISARATRTAAVGAIIARDTKKRKAEDMTRVWVVMIATGRYMPILSDQQRQVQVEIE